METKNKAKKMEVNDTGLAFIREYCKDNCKKMRQVVNAIIGKHMEQCNLLGISQKDYDEFYSIANEELLIAASKYNSERGDFGGFYYRMVENAIKSYLSQIQSQKRMARVETSDGKTIPSKTVSMEDLIKEIFGDDTEMSGTDTIPDDMDLELEVLERIMSQDKVGKFLDKLSRTQRKMVILLSEGYTVKDICGILEIPLKRYNENFEIIKLFENIKILM